MSESPAPPESESRTPTAPPPTPVITARPRFFSLVWLVPLAAALTGLWLGYASYRDRGPEILIRFASGSGIAAGKTPIKYRGVTVGMVRKVELDQPSGEVNVHARLNRESADFAREDSQFWLVSPRISLKEASGLDTLLAGQYITVRPGTGPSLHRFRALDAPPMGGLNAPGLHLVLEVAELGAITPGSAVLHRNIPVGEVTHYDPPGATGPIRVHVNIDDAHRARVRQGSRFWNASGVSLDAGLSGVKFRLESITTLIEGGVAFDLPPGEPEGEPAAEGGVYALHPDRQTALESGPVVWLACADPEGVRPGAAVKWRGTPVGRVRQVRALPDLSGAELEVALQRGAEPLARAGALYWLVRPGFAEAGVQGAPALLSGPYLETARGQGPATNRFVCAEGAPAYLPDTPGLHIRLLAPRALPRGTPLRHRGLPVGTVHGAELDAQTGWMIVHATVDPGAGLKLTSHAAFWLDSGATIDANWNGVTARLPSLAGLVATGIGVETSAEGKPADEGMLFPLHDSREEARPDGFLLTLRMPSARGMLEKAAVNYRGVTIGRVERLLAKPDDAAWPVHAEVRLEKGSESFARAGAEFWMVEPTLSMHGSSNLFAYVTGPWLECRPGTGERLTVLDLRPQAPEADRPAGRVARLFSPRPTRVKPGDPVYFFGEEVGEVIARQLADGPALRLEVALRPGHERRLLATSRFHEVPALEVKGGLGGLQAKLAPAAALLRGGIAFLPGEAGSPPAPEAQEFELFPSESAAHEGGELVTVRFPEPNGLRAGAEVRHREAVVGRVEEVRLESRDRPGLVARLRLFTSNPEFARAGARFWVETPALSLRGVRNPSSVVLGPFVGAHPGDGTPLSPSVPVNALPAAPAPEDGGLEITLETTSAASLSPGVPLLHREVVVGRVTEVGFGNSSERIRVRARIAPRYAPLVTADTRFWRAGGLSVDVGWKGAKVRMPSLETLLAGGIAFSAPAPGPAPAADAVFTLHDEPEEAWPKWAPAIPLAPE